METEEEVNNTLDDYSRDTVLMLINWVLDDYHGYAEEDLGPEDKTVVEDIHKLADHLGFKLEARKQM